MMSFASTNQDESKIVPVTPGRRRVVSVGGRDETAEPPRGMLLSQTAPTI
jgi:hypothetical protein